MKDMKGASATTDVGEGVVAGGAAVATGSTAGGTVKSLRVRRIVVRGKRFRISPEPTSVKGLGALQALSYGVHKSVTLWLITVAKILSAISWFLYDESVSVYSQPVSYNFFSLISTFVWVAVVASAVSAAFLLSSESLQVEREKQPDATAFKKAMDEATAAETKRLWNSRAILLVTFLIVAALAFNLFP